VVSFATVAALRYDALRAGWGELRRRGLERDLGRFVIVQPEDHLMRTCAELRASRERASHALGQKIHEADRWIAATALRLKTDLVSDDAIFRNVPGLTVRTLTQR
jgi:predicted nucleic acid-binding protein